jgi:protoporphyrinogen oxidase
MEIKTKHLIIGAGPTGLGAGYRLKELGMHDFVIVDKESVAGGLSRSFVDDKGFTWDIGGHVQFSHYNYFDTVMQKAISKEDWIEHVREAWVWMKDRFIPYPFQNNIHRLPKDDFESCFSNLLENPHKNKKLKNFEDWILASFGEGIAKVFLNPYNFKVWAFQPYKLNSRWVGERVATVDLKRIFNNFLTDKDDVAWGPNNTFAFPKFGGTGNIWLRVANLIGEDKFLFNTELASLDMTNKIATFNDGKTILFENILSTIPINVLLGLTSPKNEELIEKSKKLKYSTSHIVGIGLIGKIPEKLRTKCWMYFSEENCPFYRVTAFSNYSYNNVPDITKQWSLMAETSESEDKPVSADSIVTETIDGLLKTKLIGSEKEIESIWYYKAPFGYPTPSIERDDILEQIIPSLDNIQLYSRGRFGGWKYEVSNQDHSFMQGVEWVNKIELSVPETTYFYPNIVNEKWGKR